MRTIKWGIIGCGDVTEVKSGPAFNKVKNSELVAVMRRNGAKAEDYARRHKVAKWYSDAQELIDDPEVNAIYVATPPKSHEEYTIRALQAGKPVYVEKPMTIDSASAERMLESSVKTGTKLCVAHYRKEQARFKKVKALLDANEIGTVRFVNLQLIQYHHSQLTIKTEEFWRVDPAISGGGLFHDLSPHQLDLIQYFFGEYKNASGFSMNQGGLYAADDLTVGNISFTVFNTNKITVSKNGKEEILEFDELQHVQQPMIEAVVNYFLGEASNPSTAESAVDTMRIIDSFAKKVP